MSEREKASEFIRLADQIQRIHHFLKAFWGKSMIGMFKKNLALDDHLHCFHSACYGIPCFHNHLDKAGSWRYVFPDHPKFLKLEKVLKQKKHTPNWTVRNNHEEWAFFDEAGRLFSGLSMDVIADFRATGQELFGSDANLSFVSKKTLLEEISLDGDQLLTWRKRAERTIDTQKGESNSSNTPPQSIQGLTFGNGQVFWNNKDLGISGNYRICILRKLAESMGRCVRSVVLDDASTPSEAGDNLRQAIRYLRAKIKNPKTPLVIRTIWGAGYTLEHCKSRLSHKQVTK